MSDNNHFNGNAVIVTGAGGGIGAAIATKLGRCGLSVVINYRGSEDAANAVVEKIASAGGTAIAVRADLSDTQQISTLFDRSQAAFGGISFLVNNAATRGPHQSVVDLTEQQYEDVFATNVRGPLLCTVEFAKRAREGGSVVNITSGQARTPMPAVSLYAGSKGAMEAFTRAFAADLGPRNITVNAVAPGATATEAFKSGNADDVEQTTIGNTALGRLGTPEDIADVVAFLLSDAARWITGQVVDANGGLRR